MTLDVILPVQVTKYLKQFLQSLIAQREQKWGLRVAFYGTVTPQMVDEALLTIRESLKDKEISVEDGVKLTETEALNCMVAKSTADLVMPAQPEDVWSPHKVSFLKELMEVNPGLAASGTESTMLDEEGKISGGWIWIAEDPKKVETWCKMNKPILHHPGTILKRQDLLEVGCWDSAMTACFDTDLWIRMVLKQKKVLGVPGIATRYTQYRRVEGKFSDLRKNLMADRDTLKTRYKDKWETYPGYKAWEAPAAT